MRKERRRMNPPWSDSPLYPLLKTWSKDVDVVVFSCRVDSSNCVAADFISYPSSLPPPPPMRFLCSCSLLSLVFRSSFSLVSLGSWLDDEPTRREREKTASRLSSLYKYIKSFSLCLNVEHSSFLIPHPKSSQKGDEKIPHQTSSSFTSFIL